MIQRSPVARRVLPRLRSGADVAMILDGAGKSAGGPLYRLVMRLLMQLRRIGVERATSGRRGGCRGRGGGRVLGTAAAGDDAGRCKIAASGTTGIC